MKKFLIGLLSKSRMLLDDEVIQLNLPPVDRPTQLTEQERADYESALRFRNQQSDQAIFLSQEFLIRVLVLIRSNNLTDHARRTICRDAADIVGMTEMADVNKA